MQEILSNNSLPEWYWPEQDSLNIQSFKAIFFLVTPHSMQDLSSFPNQGLNLCPLQQKLGVLTTRLPEKSQDYLLNNCQRGWLTDFVLFCFGFIVLMLTMPWYLSYKQQKQYILIEPAK